MEKKKNLAKKVSVSKKTPGAMTKDELNGILGGSNSLRPISLGSAFAMTKADYQC